MHTVRSKGCVTRHTPDASPAARAEQMQCSSSRRFDLFSRLQPQVRRCWRRCGRRACAGSRRSGPCCVPAAPVHGTLAAQRASPALCPGLELKARTIPGPVPRPPARASLPSLHPCSSRAPLSLPLCLLGVMASFQMAELGSRGTRLPLSTLNSRSSPFTSTVRTCG